MVCGFEASGLGEKERSKKGSQALKAPRCERATRPTPQRLVRSRTSVALGSLVRRASHTFNCARLQRSTESTTRMSRGKRSELEQRESIGRAGTRSYKTRSNDDEEERDNRRGYRRMCERG